MFDELVRRLRTMADWAGISFLDESENVRYNLSEAADAIEALSQKEKTTQWIPVTERLPDTMKDKSAYSGWSAEISPSDDVLCYLGSEKQQTVAWYSHTYEEWTTVDENTVYKYGEITHWMPLPAPPKEG